MNEINWNVIGNNNEGILDNKRDELNVIDGKITQVEKSIERINKLMRTEDNLPKSVIANIQQLEMEQAKLIQDKANVENEPKKLHSS